MHISVTKWWIVGYSSGALWDLRGGSILIILPETTDYFAQLIWQKIACCKRGTQRLKESRAMVLNIPYISNIQLIADFHYCNMVHFLWYTWNTQITQQPNFPWNNCETPHYNHKLGPSIHHIIRLLGYKINTINYIYSKFKQVNSQIHWTTS